MPIRGLLDVQEAAFDPEDITALIAAHEMALERLGVTDGSTSRAFHGSLAALGFGVALNS
jgi:hypothetical protein